MYLLDGVMLRMRRGCRCDTDSSKARLVFLDSAVRGLATATQISVIHIRPSFAKRRVAEGCALRGSGQGIQPSMPRRLSRTPLEHHDAIPMTSPVASSFATTSRDTPCVWRECAGQICSAASLRPALQVRPAVARRQHWSTTTPSQ